MSAARRLISGSVASWVRLGLNLVSQIALVPIYLTHWDKETYGIWLAVQTFSVFVQIFDTGHQTYLQNEFLRIGQKRHRLLKRTLWSSVAVAVLLGLLQTVAVGGIILLNLHFRFLGINHAAVGDHVKSVGAAVAVILWGNALQWWAFGSIGGIFVRVLAVEGYYARMAWWGVWAQIAGTFFPAIAVLFGADLMVAGWVYLIASLIINILTIVDIWFVLVKLNLGWSRPKMSVGIKNLVLSQVVTLTTLMDTGRVTGIRLLLVPLVGAGEMATFSTLRTGANVLLQKLNTITGPLMPELMRCLNARDQARSEIAFGTVWVAVLAVLAPGTVLLQIVAPTIFRLWTHGKIVCDPLLFGTLTMPVLVYAAAQPAISVVQGNSLLPPRLIASIASGIVLLGSLYILVHIDGIQGAGWALLLAEIVSGGCYLYYADDWLKRNEMRWPWAAFWCVVASLGATALSIVAMVMWSRFQLPIAGGTILLQMAILVFYWRIMPKLARDRVASLVEKQLPSPLAQRLAGALR